MAKQLFKVAVSSYVLPRNIFHQQREFNTGNWKSERTKEGIMKYTILMKSSFFIHRARVEVITIQIF
jgi:hypothetical protein